MWITQSDTIHPTNVSEIAVAGPDTCIGEDHHKTQPESLVATAEHKRKPSSPRKHTKATQDVSAPEISSSMANNLYMSKSQEDCTTSASSLYVPSVISTQYHPPTRTESLAPNLSRGHLLNLLDSTLKLFEDGKEETGLAVNEAKACPNPSIQQDSASIVDSRSQDQE